MMEKPRSPIFPSVRVTISPTKDMPAFFTRVINAMRSAGLSMNDMIAYRLSVSKAKDYEELESTTRLWVTVVNTSEELETPK